MVKWAFVSLPDLVVTILSAASMPPARAWPDYLQASWLRCAHQTSATLWHPPHSAKGQTLQSLRQRKRDLLTTGEMALEDLYEFMEGRPCALLLTDERLPAGPDRPPRHPARAGGAGVWPRRLLQRGRIGTNAINLAALEGCHSASAVPSTSIRPSIPGTAAPARSTTATAVRSPSWR